MSSAMLSQLDKVITAARDHWSEDQLPEVLFQLTEARYKLRRIMALCEDMEPEDRAAILEVIDPHNAGREQT